MFTYYHKNCECNEILGELFLILSYHSLAPTSSSRLNHTKSLPRNKSLSGFLAGPTGLGPATSAVTVQRSNQAELRPHNTAIMLSA